MLSYYMHRDSLTGLWDKTYAVEKVKKADSFAILVRLADCDNMPLYEAEENIKRTGRLISNITFGEIARIEYGDFMIFTENGEAEADKIFEFLNEFRDEDFSHAVSGKRIEADMDFDALHKVLCAGVALARLTGNKKAIY